MVRDVVFVSAEQRNITYSRRQPEPELSAQPKHLLCDFRAVSCANARMKADDNDIAEEGGIARYQVQYSLEINALGNRSVQLERSPDFCEVRISTGSS
jgi:hypothetical protein